MSTDELEAKKTSLVLEMRIIEDAIEGLEAELQELINEKRHEQMLQQLALLLDEEQFKLAKSALVNARSARIDAEAAVASVIQRGK